MTALKALLHCRELLDAEIDSYNYDETPAKHCDDLDALVEQWQVVELAIRKIIDSSTSNTQPIGAKP